MVGVYIDVEWPRQSTGGSSDASLTDSAPFRQVGDSIHGHMHRVGEMVDRLLADGWSVNLWGDRVVCYAPHLETAGEAKHHLRALGIAPEEVLIDEEGGDWSEEGERDDCRFTDGVGLMGGEVCH